MTEDSKKQTVLLLETREILKQSVQVFKPFQQTAHEWQAQLSPSWMHSPATANKHHVSPNNVITPSDNTEYNDKPHLRSHGKTLPWEPRNLHTLTIEENQNEVQNIFSKSNERIADKESRTGKKKDTEGLESLNKEQSN